MRVFVALVIMLAGCSFYGARTVRRVAPDRVECRADIAVPIVDTVVALGGFGAAIALHSSADAEAPLNARVERTGATVAAVIAALSTVSAIYGYGAVASCERMEQHARAEQQATADRARVHEQAQAAAWAQTKAAALAARNGDCATVETLETEVRDLDGEFHRGVFLRDVAIMRCLAPPVAAPAAAR